MADLFVPQSGDHGTNQAIAALIEHVVALEGPASAPVEAPVEPAPVVESVVTPPAPVEQPAAPAPSQPTPPASDAWTPPAPPAEPTTTA